MINYIDPDKPCKVCKHRGDEHFEFVQRRYADNSRCRVVTSTWVWPTQEFKMEQCKCYIYEPVNNLEYLEYLYEKKQICK